MNAQLKIGDKVTITGFGIGRKGQLVINGVNPMTRRKCRPVRAAMFVITGEEMAGVKIAPSLGQ